MEIKPKRLLFLVLLLGFGGVYGLPAQSLIDATEPGARAAAWGKAVSASIHDPMAALWNPAGLAFMQDAQFRISSNGPFSFNYIGASQFFPLVGTVSANLSRYVLHQKIARDSATIEIVSSTLDRVTLGFSRKVAQTVFIGSSVHYNSLQSTRFATFSLGIIFMPFAGNSKSKTAFYEDEILNPVYLPANVSFAIVAQDLPLGTKYLDGFLEVSAFYQYHRSGPTFQAALRTDFDREIFRAGIGFAMTQKLNFFAGVDGLDMNKAAFGAGWLASRYNFDVAYSLEQKQILIDLSVRFGNFPSQRAAAQKKQSVEKARAGDYAGALKAMNRYMDYAPHDSMAASLKNWLLEKASAREKRILQLLAEAERHEANQWYISAAQAYLQVLELEPNHKQAQKRLKEISPKVDSYVDDLYRRGIKAYEEGDYQKAERAFDVVLKVRKNYPGAREYQEKVKAYFVHQSNELFLRGLGYYHQKNYDMAIKSLEKALEYNANNTEASQYLKKAIEARQDTEAQCAELLVRAATAERHADYARAYKAYKQVLELNPYHDAARKQLRRIEPKLKRYVDGLIARGIALYDQGEYGQAGAVFREALDIDPRRSEAKQYIARLRSDSQRRIDIKFQEGKKFLQKGDYTRAIAAFDEVLRFDSNHTQARYLRNEAYSQSSFAEKLHQADARFRDGQYLAALSLYNQLMERDSSNVHVRQRLEACQQQLNALVEKYVNQGISYYAEEKYTDAIREWDQALAINPNHTQALNYRKKAQDRLNALRRLK